MLLQRTITPQILDSLQPNKVVVLFGPRRVGKTVLIQQILKNTKHSFLLLNGEDVATQELLQRRSIQNYRNILGETQLLVIDEAQAIPDIGSILKLIVDNIDNIKILVTGSSAFDIENTVGEPLTGRKKTYRLFALSEEEFGQIEQVTQKKDNLHQRLVFGNYPELIHLASMEDRSDYLKEVVNSYLLKDILAFETVNNSGKIKNLLRLIAFQIGNEVSLQELGNQLSLSKNTVEKYLDLLTKVFVLHKVEGFSRNLRKEVSKSSRWYFYDNGLRNALIANLSPLALRDDIGKLWENYIISERLKYQKYHKIIVNNYFWRTYDQQEIDWVEEREGALYGYEFKWKTNKKVKAPVAWRKSYENASFEVVDPSNYLDWVIKNRD